MSPSKPLLRINFFVTNVEHFDQMPRKCTHSFYHDYIIQFTIFLIQAKHNMRIWVRILYGRQCPVFMFNYLFRGGNGGKADGVRNWSRWGVEPSQLDGYLHFLCLHLDLHHLANLGTRLPPPLINIQPHYSLYWTTYNRFIKKQLPFHLGFTVLKVFLVKLIWEFSRIHDGCMGWI